MNLGVGTASLLLIIATGQSGLSIPAGVDATYFEGRWAFEEDDCENPTNWTMISGGLFVSEDLSGKWQWDDGNLLLKLVDLAVDEVSGEAGERFEMEGPVTIIDPNRFNFRIEPDVYRLKRCL